MKNKKSIASSNVINTPGPIDTYIPSNTTTNPQIFDPTQPYKYSSPYTTINGGTADWLTSALQNTTYSNIAWDSVIKNLPPLFKVNTLNIVGNQVELAYEQVYFSKKFGFFPRQGTIYIANADFYGVFSSENNLYWEHVLILDTDTIDKARNIMPGDYFMCINNFDINLSNEELIKLIKSPTQYLRYCHKKFEETLGDCSRERAYEEHAKFHKMLLNE